MVDTMEDLLGGEVYHYHSKLTAKEPYDGGAWEWHQDYGYWYHNGCLFPYMASVMVALDRTHEARTAACRCCAART
jgi:ectoine hydroxylase